MTHTETLRLALEALENLGNHDRVCPQWPTYAEPENYPKCNCGYDQAITAIKAALEAKDEPVAWKWHQAPVKTSWGHEMVVADLAIDKDNTVSVYCERDQTTKVEAMFSTPPQQEAKDEPVAWVYPEFWQHLENLNCGTAYRLSGIGRQPLYTTPPQRTWVGLTDEEASEIGQQANRFDWLTDYSEAIDFVIEATTTKLKEKST